MGAGISPTAIYNRKYRALKRFQAQLNELGIHSKYKNLELHGLYFCAYHAGLGPASNGERCWWLVLRINEKNKPSPFLNQDGDRDFHNFTTAKAGRMEEGLKHLKHISDEFALATLRD